MRKIFNLRRLDMQVSILVISLVLFASVTLFLFSYFLSYQGMLTDLEHRVISVSDYVETHIDYTDFTNVSTKEDMEKEEYIELQYFLSSTREASSTQYLYTATINEDGNLIYHIDGLPLDHPDFRAVGDLIEPDFQESLLLALEDKIVLPDNILHTEWGNVFVAYTPLHDNNGKVVGALGVEFTAEDQYSTYLILRLSAPIIILLVCIIAVTISNFLFRRISNPHFKDLANTDLLTKLKNRNAFDIDTGNLIASKRITNYALFLCDLNGLKQVNDQYGHVQGDNYISTFARVLLESSPDAITYRIGGDEFATLIENYSEEQAKLYTEETMKKFQEIYVGPATLASVSMGYAFCKENTRESWEQSMIDADAMMYEVKRNFYAQNKTFDTRTN